MRSLRTFRHEALLYAGEDEFVARIAAFARQGVEAGEPVLVVVDAQKIERLRDELGSDAERVLFADMAEVGSNPARIIPAWQDFLDEHGGGGRPVRGAGEPIYPERTPAELVESQHHESLLNLAFAGRPAFWLLCPYDTEALPPHVIQEALRTHPHVTADGTWATSDTYHGLAAAAAPLADPLPDPDVRADELHFAAGPLVHVRELVARHARTAGLDWHRTADLVVASHEIATNSIRHGGGSGALRIWNEPDAVVCEVRDRGHIDKPLVGRERPELGQIDGRGLWLANQLCDLVQIRTSRAGSVVRLHMRRPAALVVAAAG
jgi:anti-sigma regulatory factor (Ser/Thr protein kinase)